MNKQRNSIETNNSNENQRTENPGKQIGGND